MQTTQMLAVAALVLAPAAATAGYLEDWDTDPPGSNLAFDNFSATAAPAPPTLLLLAAGLLVHHLGARPRRTR
ncbi:hypothetical protein [uncultured Thiohalocapsa sp.]|uniref:hypothetical protein n=1 Tax=uncultured Thiohalocapsa sp. TaxID=768990 RepID=UPI0025CF7B77|nr:hypothetical protein [uncultured Thiohalocapsa sp.]